MTQIPAGEDAAVSGCGHMWHSVIAHESRDEAIRTQAGLDKVATQLRQTASAVAAALVTVGLAPRAVPGRVLDTLPEPAP